MQLNFDAHPPPPESSHNSYLVLGGPWGRGGEEEYAAVRLLVEVAGEAGERRALRRVAVGRDEELPDSPERVGHVRQERHRDDGRQRGEGERRHF